ncbi:chemotaxis protein CheB [Methylococcus sp. EFPC2]|uniref:chemotaxis protein CheB n=1 Tax=Methylococcus sp. EFPC2 TaxID=2812648 RepID=UPI001967C390|nr:chemotaxis protein CheB [Methylococcus sp. EFPC2]QSA98494.1 PAS domain-containing protein [Methylococcus sp. EFPC2]
MIRKKKAPPAAVVATDLAPSLALPAREFPIVGIGASAGGLAAFEAFFSGMPADTDPGMAFVLVQHLAPDHKSILSDLLKRYTRMQVFEVEDGMAVRPNCAYIIPPNRDMALLNGALQLLEPNAPRGQRLPIDFFFRSLAQDQREHAICIVLSGTGSDGTQGVRAIKAEGGMVMAQAPETTEYDGMPRSAIATGMTDFVLPPAAMLAQLISYTRQAFGKTTRSVLPPACNDEDSLRKIFVLLRTHTSHDFSLYKRNTIVRRVERRMAVHQIERLDDYVRYCQHTPAEIKALFRDLLIGVTQFFRDPTEFKAVQEQVIPRLFVGKPPGSVVRIWVPGCSTGEEAYSLAILIQEHLEVTKKNVKVQLFATDIDSQGIETARAGLYPASIAADVTPERLARFFIKEADGNAYRIQKSIRDLLIFSEQDVIKDPPFSKLDLISCRNLLIYLGGELQKKLIPLFHYALNPGGLLFFGTAESVGEFVDLFSTLDRKAKLYLRKDNVHGTYRMATASFIPPLPVSVPRTDGKTPHDAKSPLREQTELALLQHYAAVAALITARGDILYLHGRTGRYLEPAPGEAGMNILKMAREGLRPALTTALHLAASQQAPVSHPGLQIKTNGDFSPVDLTVRPAGATATADQALFLVVLEDVPATRQVVNTEARPTASDDKAMAVDTRIAALQQELRAKEDYLQSSIEELEASNEELKSSNEEMQSVNEELQSTNEELETSKEELQSVNEELATVNGELQCKLVDLARANNDMSNLLASTDIGTIFVDHQLLIQRYTPAVTEIINLIPTDVGRPVGHIVSNLVGYGTLVEDVRAVLDRLIPKEIEVQTQAGAWYLLRIRPYRTIENVIEGAVIAFIDITELKRTQALMRESQALRHLAVVVRDSRDAILVVDTAGRIQAWNPAAERLYGWREDEALAKNIGEIIPEGLRSEALETAQRLSKAEELAPYATERIAKDGRTVPIWLTATALVNEAGEVYAVATTERIRETDGSP